ncbi:MAG: DUF1592 domain-containing protein, partial [Planctomycetes bacterium]|nr:DUF1592 domain-containing protein [Planctomycetota bacterium]
RRPAFIAAGLAALLGGAPAAQAGPPEPGIDYETAVRPVLAEHCFRCHGDRKQKGDIRLDDLDPQMTTRAAAEVWHSALDMINGKEMPPDDEPQPTEAERRAVVRWLDESLALAAQRQRGERQVVLRRLTRRQYTNSLQQLLGLTIDFGRVLPADAISKSGFSNNGEALQASPLHLDYYQQIARTALEQAIHVGDRPAAAHYRVTFGSGIGKGKVAAFTGGYQSVPLPTDDFMIEILDRQGAPITPTDDAGRAEFDRIRKRISVGLRGSGQDRFRVVDEGMILLSALPHREVTPKSWQGPSPNLKLEMQRCWPERGDFVMRVRASRGYVPPLREQILVGLDEPVAMTTLDDADNVVARDGAQVLPAAASDQRSNVSLTDDVITAIDVPKPSRARLRFDLPADGFYQIDLVHPPVAADAMPSVRLEVAGHNIDQRPAMTAAQLTRRRVVTPLGAIGMRAGRHHLTVGGPFFLGFAAVVVTSMPADHPLVRRLSARADEQTAAVADLIPSIRALLGTRTDDGMDYRTFDEPREVRAPLGTPETYEFRGRLENLPIPEPESGDTEILSGFLLLGLWNDHLVKTPRETGPPLLIESIEFEAPVFEQWPPRSHTDIFFASEHSGDRETYTREVLTRFLARAFRRPPRADEIERYLAFWRDVRDDHDAYEDGVREVLIAILCSPNFLYLAEPDEAADADGVLADGLLADWAVANRLSYFLWNSPPDAALRELAAEGRLQDELLPQVDRMIDDDRAWRMVRSFTYEWLRLDRHAEMTINPDRHPDYTRFVKRDMAEETYAFVHRVLHEDLSILTLIDSDFAMLNQNLAEFYGIDGVRGPHLRPVPVTRAQRRGGLLAQGSFLAGHSDGSEPHPVKRAVWLRARLLGDPPPAPPPNVPRLDPDTPGFDKLTLKQQLEAHRDNPSCHDCHAGIDPFGIAFERLSAVGRYEPERRGLAVDATSTLPDGTTVDGLYGITDYLLAHKRDAFARALIEHLFAYAMGRDLDFADGPEIEQILNHVQLAGYRMRAVIRSIARTPSFSRR